MKKIFSIPFCLAYMVFCIGSGFFVWMSHIIQTKNRPQFKVLEPLRIEAVEEPYVPGFRAWWDRFLHGSQRKYRLTDDYVFLLSDTWYRVKKGFVFDGATLPRFLWFFYGTPWTGPQRWAAPPHDAAYAGCLEYFPDGWRRWDNFSRKNADKLFREILKAKHASRFKYRGMYRGVRIFGGSHYSRIKTVDRSAVLG